MPPSLRLALNALTGRRWRTILLIAAVGVAAALVVAVSTTSQSVQASLDDRLGQFLGSADVRIIHQGNGRFEEAWLERARGWEGVVAATARLSGSLVLVRADGRTDPETGRPLRATPGARTSARPTAPRPPPSARIRSSGGACRRVRGRSSSIR